MGNGTQLPKLNGRLGLHPWLPRCCATSARRNSSRSHVSSRAERSSARDPLAPDVTQ